MLWGCLSVCFFFPALLWSAALHWLKWHNWVLMFSKVKLIIHQYWRTKEYYALKWGLPKVLHFFFLNHWSYKMNFYLIFKHYYYFFLNRWPLNVWLCTDSSYRSFYSSGDPPTVAELGQLVFVEVFLKHQDEDLVLLLDDCWATPTEDPHDPYRWNLLVKGWKREMICNVSVFWDKNSSSGVSLSIEGVPSVVTATERSYCLFPRRRWRVPLFTNGLLWNCFPLWNLQHLKTWCVISSLSTV